MAIAIDACAAQHQGDRKEQQDRVAILPHARRKGVALAVVADGMGGHTGGALAAEQVVHTAKTNLDQFLGADESPATNAAQQHAGGAYHDQGVALHEREGSAQHRRHAAAATRAGDLGALWRQPALSFSRQATGAAVTVRPLLRRTSGRYRENYCATGADPPQSQCAARFAGRTGDPRVSLDEVTELMAGDTFVLCSDGLWGYFDDVRTGHAWLPTTRPARPANC